MSEGCFFSYFLLTVVQFHYFTEVNRNQWIMLLCGSPCSFQDYVHSSWSPTFDHLAVYYQLQYNEMKLWQAHYILVNSKQIMSNTGLHNCEKWWYTMQQQRAASGNRQISPLLIFMSYVNCINNVTTQWQQTQ